MTAKAIPELTERQIENFWKKVEKVEGGCWNWTGATGSGYGMWKLPSGFVRPHRVAWVLAGKLLHPALTLDHKCENPLCVKPDHLQQVTQSENSKRGYERHPERYCQLTDEQKKERNRLRQAEWRAKNPERSKAHQRKYYELSGKEKRKAKWKEFQAAYKALEPPDDEDHGYAS